MIEFYQNVPSYINPIAVQLGPVAVHWYSLMWLLAFACVYFLLQWRNKKGEGSYTKEILQDAVYNSLFGALVGGRIGYAIFYDPAFFLANPLALFVPYDFAAGAWTGIFGMSYHGGVIGVALALVWTVRKHKLHFWQFLDFIIPAVPLGYTFGRIGNFLNSELVGRPTETMWGMYFHGEQILRHPSQLYEAFGEGILIFMGLWILRNAFHKYAGFLTAVYLMDYAIIRFVIEFVRTPDAHLGFVLASWTMGQVLSLVMFVCGAGLMVYVLVMQKRNNTQVS